MSYHERRTVGELTLILIVVTLCLTFLLWIGTALLRWHNTPYYPPKLDSLESAVMACKEKGGIPYTKWQDRDGYSPSEILDRCDEKQPAQQ